MEKGMNNRQATCLLILFISGNSSLFGVGSPAGRDSWIALLLACIIALLVTSIYSRIQRLNASHDFFDALSILFGKWGGRILTILMVWYALHLSALLMRTLTELGMATSIVEPPYYIVLILFTLAGIYLLRSGAATLGRWAFIIFIVLFLVNGFIVIASIKNMQILNLFPILRRPAGELMQGTAQYLSFPMLESIVFLPLLFGKKTNFDAAKIYRFGILIGAGMLLTIVVSTFLLLGEPMMSEIYFPSHNAAKLISVGNFLTRVEEIVSVFMLLTGVTKFVVCLLTAAKGLAHLCGSTDSTAFAVPTGMFSFSFSLIVANNIMDIDRFLAIYPFYALPFQVLLPIIIWCRSEYRSFQKKRLQAHG